MELIRGKTIFKKQSSQNIIKIIYSITKGEDTPAHSVIMSCILLMFYPISSCILNKILFTIFQIL